MRNYPSVPNVFRVASSHNVNNEATYAPVAPAAPAALAYTNTQLGGGEEGPAGTILMATCDANSTTTATNVLHQPQQQQQLKRAQQSLANVTKTIAIGTPTVTTIQNTIATSMLTISTAQTGSNSFGSSYENEQLKQKQYQQQQFQRHQQQKQQQQQRYQFHVGQSVNVNGANGAKGASCSSSNNNCNGNDAIINKLTTTASIEHTSSGAVGVSYQNGRAQYQQHYQQQQLQEQEPQQHSPFTTLPRSISGIGIENSGGNRNNGISGRSVAGVINTISGSIPATGFIVSGNAASIGSDLNLVLNNSCSDLRKLNGESNICSRMQQQYENYNFTRTSKDINDRHDFLLKSTREMSTSQASEYGGHHNCNNNNNNNSYLWILTPVAASISVAIVIAALAGPQWLFTEEKLPNTLYNGTSNLNMLDDGAYITKYTKSSLWILCTTMQGIETYNCIKIDYFSKEGYQPDPHDSTSAIPYTVTKSCPFFLASGIALLISFIVFLIPTCSHQNSLYYFSAGIMFIVSGLLMLIGLIAYISILKAEIGSKLRSRSTLQPALFKVNYGQSFFLFVFGFIATEFVGLLNIFLYISLQEISYYSRLTCFTLANVREKIKEGKNPRIQTYKSYKKTNTTNNIDKKRMQHRRTSCGQMRQVHNVRAPMPQHLVGSETQQKPCRRHPNATEANNFDLERRFYFDDATPSMMRKCNLHTSNLAKSLNELYTAQPPPPPPPLAVKAGIAQTFAHPGQQQQQPQSPTVARFADLPQEFPLTRSISTTTELFQNNNDMIEMRGSAMPHLEHRNRRNMTTNTQLRPTDTEMTRNECSDTRQLSANHRRQPNEVSHNNGQRNRDSNRNFMENNDIVDEDDDDAGDGEPQDDEEPQKLCGLKRSIRKTKDELFHEFCKRAGVRAKPKNIYYIANVEEMLRRKRHNGDLGGKANGGLKTVVDEAEFEADDDGFKQLAGQNEQIYGAEAAYQTRNMRRASMFVEPTHLKKLNSNLSLHTLYTTDNRTTQQKTDFYDTIRAEVTNKPWPAYPEPLCANYGGSQNRLDSNTQLHQSRATLPRSFLRNSTDSQDSIASASLQALHNAYSASQTRLTNLMLQPQQQLLQPQDRLLSVPRGSVGYMHNSVDNLNTKNYMPDLAHRPNNGNTLQQPIIQWPAAIPSSPSNFSGNYTIYDTATARNHHPSELQHALVSRSASSGGSSVATNGQPKFQRGYAFDEQRRASALTDAFDLDEMERDRKRSHASLFNGVVPIALHNFSATNSTNSAGDHFDLVNGTAV